MRRILLPLLAALLLLTACGAPAGQEESLFLPETGPAGAVSAPAIVTEGRTPAEDYNLPQKLTRMENGIDGTTVLLAELPEADAAFYGVHGLNTALIRWGDSLAEFDWSYATPRTVLPVLWRFDADGDGEEELVVDCYAGSGTGASVEELHILEKGPDGTLTDYALPESLWMEQVPALFEIAAVSGRTFAVLGRELVEIDGENLDLGSASSGLIAGFTADSSSVTFHGAVCLSHEDSAFPCYVAETSAEVRYEDGVFTLQYFHLYSYD